MGTRAKWLSMGAVFQVLAALSLATVGCADESEESFGDETTGEAALETAGAADRDAPVAAETFADPGSQVTYPDPVPWEPGGHDFDPPDPCPIERPKYTAE
jgi:hypothetical protein